MFQFIYIIKSFKKSISFKSTLYRVNISAFIHILIYNTMFMEEISMYTDKSKINKDLPPSSHGYRWGCSPKVSGPSEKGHLYWNPPNFIPSIYKAKALGNTKTPGTNILEKSTIEHCMKKYMYIWLNNGTEFWSVPIIVKDNYIHIWIWNKVKWTYYTMVLDNINSFMCYWYTT